MIYLKKAPENEIVDPRDSCIQINHFVFYRDVRVSSRFGRFPFLILVVVDTYLFQEHGAFTLNIGKETVL